MKKKDEVAAATDWTIHTLTIGQCVKCGDSMGSHRMMAGVYAASLCDRCQNEWTQFFSTTDALKQWRAAEVAYYIAIQSKDTDASVKRAGELQELRTSLVMNTAAQWCAQRREKDVIQ